MHGWINLDKPLGLSSAQAVAKVKYLLGKKTKIGHAGTLDPLASGVLVLALGEATKLVNIAMDATKEYAFAATWGEERTTDDAEGEVVATSDKRPIRAEIEALIPGFVGEIMQAPPAFSAIKLDGKRAYDLARAGEVVEIKERVVRIDRLTIENITKDSATFTVTCGKGTYIRSIARDMGRKLGVYAYVSMLRRTRVGQLTEKTAISLEKLEEMVHKGDLGFLSPPQALLDDILAINLNAEETVRLKRGQWLPKPPSVQSEQMVACMSGESLVAIVRADGAFLKPERVFNII